MNRFLITNPSRFTGEAAITYNSEGLLQIIDCTDTNMDADTIKKFKAAVPVQVQNIAAGFGASTTIVEDVIKITFKEFYKDWMYKRNAYKAEEFWNKMSDSDHIIANENKREYIKYCKRQQAKFDYQPMMADTYLRKKEYLTEWHKLK